MLFEENKIKSEIDEISKIICLSDKESSTVWKGCDKVIIPFAIYFLFYFLNVIFGDSATLFLIGNGVLSLFFWAGVNRFFHRFKAVLEMLPRDALDRFLVLKIFIKKAKAYYFTWLLIMLLSGFLSFFTGLGVFVLSFITFLSSIFMALIFYYDLSRYNLTDIFCVKAAGEVILINGSEFIPDDFSTVKPFSGPSVFDVDGNGFLQETSPDYRADLNDDLHYTNPASGLAMFDTSTDIHGNSWGTLDSHHHTDPWA